MKICNDLRLLILIVPYPKGRAVVRYAKQRGAQGATLMMGQGTINNRILQWLALAENTKELLWILADESTPTLLEEIATHFNFNRRNNGIGFSIPVNQLFGARNSLGVSVDQPREENMQQHEAIIAIVPKGNGERVVEAARHGGATGATILNGRGAGIHETEKLFSLEIEPEKEIVLMVVESVQTQTICDAIINATGIDQPGQGVLFTQPISQVVGLFTK